jgi:transcriptional regulator with XRE-family HTH domain
VTRRADSEIAVEFGRRLLSAGRAAGLTQELLAEKAGLHPVTISTLENAKRSATVPTLVRVAQALDLDPAELVRGLRAGGRKQPT